jgi:hypothetical protein
MSEVPLYQHAPPPHQELFGLERPPLWSSGDASPYERGTPELTYSTPVGSEGRRGHWGTPTMALHM